MSFGVDAAALIKCGSDVSKLADEAEKIKSEAEAAIVPEQSWGELGQWLTYQDYVELTNAFMDHMDKMVQTMGRIGENIAQTGEHYQSIDTALTDGFSGFETSVED